MTKQVHVSNRLEDLKIEDVKEHDNDDYAALDNRTRRISQLVIMVK